MKARQLTCASSRPHTAPFSSVDRLEFGVRRSMHRLMLDVGP